MPKFLDKIVINSKLVRVREHKKKVWINVKLYEPIVVVLIGKRTLQNGKLEIESYPEEGHVYRYFVPDEYIKALLVVENMNKNPFYILESAIDIEKTHINSELQE